VHRIASIGAALTVIALSATACSSSGSSTTNDAVSNHPSNNAGGGSSSAPSTLAGDGGSASAFCTEVKNQAHILTLGDFDLTKVNRTDYLTELSRIVAVAPDVIKGDVQAIVAIQHDAINGHLDPSKLSSPTLIQHTQHLATWMQTNCPGVAG
jgi:hypothetical protein